MRTSLIYTNVTNNVDLRVAQHNDGIDPACYTYKRRPVELMYTEGFQYHHQAIELEKQIKRWPGKKKDALIAGDWNKLIALSANRQNTMEKDIQE